MKQIKLTGKSMLLIVIFVISVSTVKAQHATPQKKDNVIIIFGNRSATKNFMSFGKYLVDEGFSFASKDKDFLSLKTNERTSKGGYKYTLTISFKDSLIEIRPRCNYVVFGSTIGHVKLDWIDWHYTKAKSSSFGIAFKAFEPILKKYNGKLYYSKEE